MPVYGVSPEPCSVGIVPPPRVAGHPARGRGPIETAFVLSGGGNRGASQVGMLRALSERGVVPDLVVGTSIGAVNAAFFAGQPTLEGTYLMAEMWRNIATEDVFPHGRLHGTWRFLERRDGVYPIEGLRKLVAGFLRFDRLEDSPLPLTVVATRLADGAETWLSEGPAVDSVLASAALPAVFPVVEVDGARYLDGGVLNNAPISVALAGGARRIYLLLCGDVNSRAQSSARPYEAMLVAFGLSIRARLRRDLATLPEGVEVIVLQQSGIDEVMWQDFSRTEEMLERGYLDSRVVLDRVDEQLAERGIARPGAGWWSRTHGRPPAPKRQSRLGRAS